MARLLEKIDGANGVFASTRIYTKTSTNMAAPEIYTVTKFGCNSGHNDMCPPSTKLFYSKEEAYKYYSVTKDEIVQMKEDYAIGYEMHTYLDGECIMQNGDDAKRPVGISITKH